MKYSKGHLFIFLKQKSSSLLFLIETTASLMALKGINQYFSAPIRLTKTKFLTPVHIKWNISIIPLAEYVHPSGLLTSKRHSLRSETAFGIAKKAWNI